MCLRLHLLVPVSQASRRARLQLHWKLWPPPAQLGCAGSTQLYLTIPNAIAGSKDEVFFCISYFVMTSRAVWIVFCTKIITYFLNEINAVGRLVGFSSFSKPFLGWISASPHQDLSLGGIWGLLRLFPQALPLPAWPPSKRHGTALVALGMEIAFI